MSKNSRKRNGCQEYLVEDLGLAAYLHMMSFTLSRVTKAGFYFLIHDGHEKQDIQNQKFEYFNSAFVRYDQTLQSLRKLKRESGKNLESHARKPETTQVDKNSATRDS